MRKSAKDRICLRSEGIDIVATEELSILRSIVAHNADHLVHVRTYLHAASKSHIGRIGFISRSESPLFSRWLHVQFVKPRVWDVHGTLSARHSCRVEIIGNLVSSHLVLLVTTGTVSEDTWGLVTSQHFQ